MNEVGLFWVEKMTYINIANNLTVQSRLKKKKNIKSK